MKRGSQVIIGIVAIAALVVASPTLAEEVVGGVSDGTQVESTTNSLDFDPPCLFAQTLPLLIEQNLDTNALFVVGNGAVLNECSNFRVDGYSPPNFLAWNCTAHNIDGSAPALPQIIQFQKPVSSFSCKVGTGLHTGNAAIIAMDAGFNWVDVDSVSVASTLQLLQVSGNANIKYIYIVGPCTLVMDDLHFN